LRVAEGHLNEAPKGAKLGEWVWGASWASLAGPAARSAAVVENACWYTLYTFGVTERLWQRENQLILG